MRPEERYAVASERLATAAREHAAALRRFDADDTDRDRLFDLARTEARLVGARRAVAELEASL